jgi:hypothetical protein
VQVQTRDLCAPAVPTVSQVAHIGPCVVQQQCMSGHGRRSPLSEDATLEFSMQDCVGPKRESLRVAQL